MPCFFCVTRVVYFTAFLIYSAFLLPDHLLQASVSLDYFNLYALAGTAIGAISVTFVFYTCLTIVLLPVVYQTIPEKTNRINRQAFIPLIILRLQRLQLPQPRSRRRVTGHAQIAAGGERNSPHLRSVGYARAFKLLGEKPPVENLQPL